MELLRTRRYWINSLISLISAFMFAVTATGALSVSGLKLSYPLKAYTGMAVFFFSYFYFTRRYRRRKKILHSPYPVNWPLLLEKHVPYYRGLDNGDRYCFIKRIQIFLEEVSITGVDMDIDDITRLLVASAAIIPVFRIPDWEYVYLTDIFVCSDSLNDNIELLRCKDDIQGLVIYNKTSVYLSREQLVDNFMKTDGNNVGIHEFMHKIDEVSGAIDGILPPPFLSKKKRDKWLTIVDQEMKKLRDDESDFKKYAMKSRAEFIAVAAEYFFEKPREMRDKHHSLYVMMEKMFRQDLAAITSDEAMNILKYN